MVVCMALPWKPSLPNIGGFCFKRFFTSTARSVCYPLLVPGDYSFLSRYLVAMNHDVDTYLD
jgi:hypothetical protein